MGAQSDVDLDALIRLEGEARRAVRALGIQSAPHAAGTVSITITEEEARY